MGDWGTEGQYQRGVFYEPVGYISAMETKAGRDPRLGDKLWKWTEEERKPCCDS